MRYYEKAVELDPDNFLNFESLGVLYERMGKYEQAKLSFKTALKLSDNISDPLGSINARARTTNNMGLVLYKEGSVEEGKKHFHQVLDMGLAFGDLPAASIALTNLSIFKRKEGDFEQAEEFLRTALFLIEDYDKPESEACIYNNWGNIYFEVEEWVTAKDFYNKTIALLTDRKIKNESLSFAYRKLSSIFMKKGEKNTALDMIEKAIEIDKSIGNKSGLGASYVLKGDMYLFMEEYDIAKMYYNKSLPLFKVSHSLSNLKTVEALIEKLNKKTCNKAISPTNKDRSCEQSEPRSYPVVEQARCG